MRWFWYFGVYSFLGFLLEAAFARLTGGRPERKCLLVIPLCPVYGLGACAVLLLPRWVQELWPALFLLGGGAATAVEYAAAVFYERGLGVSFWDYRGLPGSVQGRVCLPFSAAWGLLSAVSARFLQPLLVPLAALMPPLLTYAALLVLTADAVCSAALLRQYRDTELLSIRALVQLSSAPPAN